MQEFAISKKTPTYVVPTLTATFGETLNDVEGLTTGFDFEATDLTYKFPNAGKHYFTLTYTPDDVEHYATITGIRVEINVAKADTTVSLSGNISRAYNENEIELPTVETLSMGDRYFTWQKDYGTDDWSSCNRPTDAGRYRVKANVYSDDNYNACESDWLVFEITPTTRAALGKTLTYGFVLFNNGVDVLYIDDFEFHVGDVLSCELFMDGEPLGGAYTVEIGTEGTAGTTVSGNEVTITSVGNGKLYIKTTIAADGNFVAESPAEFAEITILKTPQTITINKNLSKAYDGDPVDLTGFYTLAEPADVTVEFKDPADSTYTTDKPTEVGTYYVRVTAAETENFLGAVAMQVFRISSGIVVTSDISKTYDGLAVSDPTYTGTTNDCTVHYFLASGEPLSAAPVNAGEYCVIVTDDVTGDYAIQNFTISKQVLSGPIVLPEGLTNIEVPYGSTLGDIMSRDNPLTLSAAQEADCGYNGEFKWAKRLNDGKWLDVLMDDEDVGDVGLNTFYVSFTSPNFEYEYAIEVTITVTKIDPPIPQNVEVELNQALYNVNLPDGWSWVDGNVTFSSLGTQTAYITHSGSWTYNAVASQEIEIIVVKASVNYYFDKLAQKGVYGSDYDGRRIVFYTGLPIAFTADFVGAGSPSEVPETVTITYKQKDAADSTYTSTAPTEVGEYVVKIVTSETAHIKETTKTYNFVITKGTNFGSYVDANESKVYMFNKYSSRNGDVLCCYVYEKPQGYWGTQAEKDALLATKPLDIFKMEVDENEGTLTVCELDTRFVVKEFYMTNGQYVPFTYGEVLYSMNIIYMDTLDVYEMTVSFNKKGDQYLKYAYNGTFTKEQLIGITPAILAGDWQITNEKYIVGSFNGETLKVEIQSDGSLRLLKPTMQYAYSTKVTDSGYGVEYDLTLAFGTVGDQKCSVYYTGKWTVAELNSLNFVGGKMTLLDWNVDPESNILTAGTANSGAFFNVNPDGTLSEGGYELQYAIVNTKTDPDTGADVYSTIGFVHFGNVFGLVRLNGIYEAGYTLSILDAVDSCGTWFYDSNKKVVGLWYVDESYNRSFIFYKVLENGSLQALNKGEQVRYVGYDRFGDPVSDQTMVFIYTQGDAIDPTTITVGSVAGHWAEAEMANHINDVVMMPSTSWQIITVNGNTYLYLTGSAFSNIYEKYYVLNDGVFEAVGGELLYIHTTETTTTAFYKHMGGLFSIAYTFDGVLTEAQILEQNLRSASSTFEWKYEYSFVLEQAVVSKPYSAQYSIGEDGKTLTKIEY